MEHKSPSDENLADLEEQVKRSRIANDLVNQIAVPLARSRTSCRVEKATDEAFDATLAFILKAVGLDESWETCIRVIVNRRVEAPNPT